MVGPQDGGFGFDQSKKYTNVDNIEEVCVQCQAGQHKKCLKKSKEQQVCECEQCMIYGQIDQTIINTIKQLDQILSSQYEFKCMFCDKEYGSDVVELALHIGRVHDQPRNLYTS